jgi:hypothetical protein
MKQLVPMTVAVLATVALLVPGSAAARGCHLDIGSAAIESNVSCHITNVVVGKAIPRITKESQKFRVYARGWWYCETAPIEKYHALVCTRRRRLITIITE